MKRFDFAQAANTLANVGVIVGIILLVLELNQNNQLLRNSNVHAQATSILTVVEQQSELLNEISRDADTARIYRRGLLDFPGLDPDEQTRFDLLMRSILMRLEAGRQAKSFGLGPEGSTFEERYVTSLVRQAGFRQWWDSADITLIPGPMQSLVVATRETLE